MKLTTMLLLAAGGYYLYTQDKKKKAATATQKEPQVHEPSPAESPADQLEGCLSCY